MKYIESECQELGKTLSSTAGLDPLQDRMYVGVIAGLKKVLNIEFDDTESVQDA